MTIYFKVEGNGKVLYANFLCAEESIIKAIREQHEKENAGGYCKTTEISKEEFHAIRAQGK